MDRSVETLRHVSKVNAFKQRTVLGICITTYYSSIASTLYPNNVEKRFADDYLVTKLEKGDYI